MEVGYFFKNLKNENLSELERKTGVSRQALHNARKTKNMKLDNFRALTNALNYEVHLKPKVSERNLLASLVDFGVPVAHAGGGNLSFSELIRASLKAARFDGTYESFLPYLLIKNADRIDPLLLAAVAFEAKEVNALGYFVEMAKAFRPHSRFTELLHLLKPAKNKTPEFLLKDAKSMFPELFTNNPYALKWNLKVRGTPENHFERWRKWQTSQENN